MSGWQFWIDRGGTFTDLVGRQPDGQLVVRKVLSVQPGVPGDPAVAAIRELLGLGPSQAIASGVIDAVRLGTTVATNALLEGPGSLCCSSPTGGWRICCASVISTARISLPWRSPSRHP